LNNYKETHEQKRIYQKKKKSIKNQNQHD
jgi:hypothetical protein